MRAALVVACAGAWLLLATPPRAAAADSAERESRRHFQAGEAHFKAGAFDAALAEYQAGYDAKPLPGFLINIAQCQRRLGDSKVARATYQKFVMVAPDSPLVPQAKAMVEELDKLLAELSNAQANPSANPSPSPSPGKEGDDAQKPKPADVEPAAAAPVVTPLVAAEPPLATSAPVLVASPAPADEAPAPARRRWWLWGTIGAVVVGGAVAAIVMSTGGTTTVHDGSLGTLRR